MKQIPEEVKAGMALLDEKTPGWREKIDLNTLDLSSCYDCVLGQIFGHFFVGDLKLKVGTDLYGFDCYPEGYDLLTQAWKEALSETSSPVAAE